MGFYTPYAVDQELTPYSNAIKIRQLFVIPNAAEREFFYGVNFEFSYAMPQFLDTRWLIEMRPIVGWRKGDYEFIINPIVDFGIGQNGGADFAPAARFARKLGDNSPSGLNITPTSDGRRTDCPSMSNNTISMQSSTSRSDAST